MFQVSSGSSGKAFVMELACLYQAYADRSSLESIALKACSVLVALTLQKPNRTIVRVKIMLLCSCCLYSQKPNRTSKSKDHVAHLNRRLSLWKGDDLSALLDEGQCIQ